MVFTWTHTRSRYFSHCTHQSLPFFNCSACIYTPWESLSWGAQVMTVILAKNVLTRYYITWPWYLPIYWLWCLTGITSICGSHRHLAMVWPEQHVTQILHQIHGTLRTWTCGSTVSVQACEFLHVQVLNLDFEPLLSSEREGNWGNVVIEYLTCHLPLKGQVILS